MNNHEMGVWESPDEERLASLMNRASQILIPCDDYSLDLKLYGVAGSQQIINELEAQFYVHLDRPKGSHLWFTLHPATRILILNQFSADLASDCGKINLQKTNIDDISPHEFIPSVELLGKNIEARSYTWHPEWQKGFLPKLVNGHGIDTEPVLDSSEIYHMWLGHNILSKAGAWLMVERLNLDQQVTEDIVTRVSFARRQNVPEDTLVCSETLSVVHESTDIGRNVTTRHRLDLISHQEERHFMRSSFQATNAEVQPISNNSFSGANADDIAEFTGIVEKVLSLEG